jgi:hypothetical protein
MEKAEATHAPIRQSVHVECPIEDAFRLFTERFAEWWPLVSHSIAGEEAEDCEIEPWVGGRVFERTRSGEEHDWGWVIAWNPPLHLEFTWHPGESEDRSQTVEVEFAVEADGTRVTLIHTGWQFAGVQAAAAQCFSKFVSEQMLVAA